MMLFFLQKASFNALSRAFADFQSAILTIFSKRVAKVSVLGKELI
jgi:hypothetical protein